MIMKMVLPPKYQVQQTHHNLLYTGKKLTSLHSLWFMALPFETKGLCGD